MSIFGSLGNTQATSNTNAASQQGGALFGGANNQQQPPQQQQPSGGLFGSLPPPQNQNQSQPAPSLFGSTNPNPNPSQQTQAPSLFGAMNTSTGQGGGLFGAQNTNSQGGLGGGLFGSQQQQPQQTGGSLFGSTSNQPQQQPAGGLLGVPAQQPHQLQPNPGLPPTGGGLFGNAQTNTSTGGGGLFGKPSISGQPTTLNVNTSTNANTSNTNTNPLFGGALGQPQQQQGANSFFAQPPQNQQQQQQQQQQRPSLFNSLGQSTSNTNPLFGAGNTSTLNTSALGSSPLGMGALSGGLGQPGGLGGLVSSTLTTNSLLSSRTPAVPAQLQADAQSQFSKLAQKIYVIAQAWDSGSPQCRFQHYFYNLVDPNQVSLYGRPPTATNEALWQRAVRENPNPTCLVPALAVGFDDLRQRVEAQSQQAATHEEKLKELKTRLESLNQRHALSNSPRLLRANSQQTQLTQRLMAFIQHLHLLIPALRSSSIRPEEEELEAQLEEIEEGVRKGRVRGKLNELWALIGAVNAAKERERGMGGSGGEWAVVDEEGLAQIAQILSEQQAGLVHLTKILQGGLRDLDVIMGTAPGGIGNEVYDDPRGGELFFQSVLSQNSSIPPENPPQPPTLFS